MWALAEKVRASAELSVAFDAGLEACGRGCGPRHGRRPFVSWTTSTSSVRRYGSRGANEWDVLAPTWEVRPDTALAAIDLMRGSDESNAPEVRHAASVAEH